MKLNNKGFTLVELLAVLVILIAIMYIAMPSISSSLDRSKTKQTVATKKLLESAAELYVTDHRNEINVACCVPIEQLIKDGYIDADQDDEIKAGYVEYDSGRYTYKAGTCNSRCINDTTE